MLSRGNSWLSVEGIPDRYHSPEEIASYLRPEVLTHCGTTPRRAPRSFCEVAPKSGSQVIEYGGEERRPPSFQDGSDFCATGVKTLRRLLPPLILIKSDQAQSHALHTTLSMIASETAASAPGSDLVINRFGGYVVHTLHPRPHRITVGSLQERLVAGDLRSAKLAPLSDPCTRKWSILGQLNRWPPSVVCHVPHLRSA